MSQDTSEDIYQQIEKYPQFRVAMFGDSNVTITPNKPPPSSDAVTNWMRSKKMNFKFHKPSLTDQKNSKSTGEINDHPKRSVNENKSHTAPHKYKKGPNFKSSKKLKAQKANIEVQSRDAAEEFDVSFKPISPPVVKSILKSPEAEFTTPSVKRRRYEDPPGSQDSPIVGSPKVLSTGGHSPAPIGGFKSSTPARRVSFEEDMALITPIPKEPKSGRRRSYRRRSHSPKEEINPDAEIDVIPPTPERPASSRIARVTPMRRLSTGGEDSLRKTILASQIKVQ